MAKEPIRLTAVMDAFFPDMIRETLKDAMAKTGMTEEDLCDLIRELESPARNQ